MRNSLVGKKIAVVGLGYVGLPLAIEFGKIYETVGFDINPERITELKNSIDRTGEIEKVLFNDSTCLKFSRDPSDLSDSDFIIIAVPTPVDGRSDPDLSYLTSASKLAAAVMKKGVTVIYESTVYPGATEEICIPILESVSGMRWLNDFNVGYSPERVNPGDRKRTLVDITKVVSGDTSETLEVLGELYGSVVKAGVYLAGSIKVAEAAKVIENTQRDLNIALMNELSIIFHKLGLDTEEVLKAAETKWNFIPFRPGLVGGHCIGVDPYYLTYKAQQMQYQPEVILAGRRINDNMANYVAEQLIRIFSSNNTNIESSRVAILGLTFKEDCSDIRNSKVFDLYNSLTGFGCKVYAHDPLADQNAVMHEYGIAVNFWDDVPENIDAVILAVPHLHYLQMPFSSLTHKLRSKGVFMDLKSKFTNLDYCEGDYDIWRL
ncbi:nucleotide sugar dehydrogenase [Polynucleobacter sp. AP-Basta-1000A-D1]|nr:nucleotide sugar dehydrogenase [Polynucleobacter bastaniensis]